MVWLLDISLLKLQDGGPIAYLRTGDIVTVDQDTKEISMAVSEEELEKRKAETTLPPLYSRGVLGKYAHIVSSASRGAVTDFWNMDKSGKKINSKSKPFRLAFFIFKSDLPA